MKKYDDLTKAWMTKNLLRELDEIRFERHNRKVDRTLMSRTELMRRMFKADSYPLFKNELMTKEKQEDIELRRQLNRFNQEMRRL